MEPVYSWTGEISSSSASRACPILSEPLHDAFVMEDMTTPHPTKIIESFVSFEITQYFPTDATNVIVGDICAEDGGKNVRVDICFVEQVLALGIGYHLSGLSELEALLCEIPASHSIATDIGPGEFVVYWAAGLAVKSLHECFESVQGNSGVAFEVFLSGE